MLVLGRQRARFNPNWGIMLVKGKWLPLRKYMEFLAETNKRGNT